MSGDPLLCLSNQQQTHAYAYTQIIYSRSHTSTCTHQPHTNTHTENIAFMCTLYKQNFFFSLKESGEDSYTSLVSQFDIETLFIVGVNVGTFSFHGTQIKAQFTNVSITAKASE